MSTSISVSDTPGLHGCGMNPTYPAGDTITPIGPGITTLTGTDRGAGVTLPAGVGDTEVITGGGTPGLTITVGTIRIGAGAETTGTTVITDVPTPETETGPGRVYTITTAMPVAEAVV